MHAHTPRTNGGNAVTLTLLGLSVAILAGVAVLYFVGKNVPQPEPFPTQAGNSTSTTPDSEQDPRAGWNTYENTEFEFSFMYPRGWIVATGTLMGEPVISVFDASQPGATSTGADVHTLPVRVSVYPYGLPTEWGTDKRAQSKTIVSVPEASALDFVLSNSTPWATLVNFVSRPPSWNEYGFVFGRAAIREEETVYYRGTATITPEQFNLETDTVDTRGYVDDVQWNTVSEILRSFEFTQQNTATDVSALITVASPAPYATVTSPLLVKGEAQGSWYFEASFPVRLLASDGSILAEVPARALSDWMVDAMVPFEVSLVFSVPAAATSGTLILARDNPSGLPDKDAHIAIPVVFP